MSAIRRLARAFGALLSPLDWLKRRRRRKLLASPVPEHWSQWVDELPFTAQLEPVARERLISIARVLVDEKSWEGCGGLELTEVMRVKIAAQAALLLLGIPHDYYSHVESILVYPTAYQNPHERRQSTGVVSAGTINAGEAWYRGPVVLSWTDAERGWLNKRDGRNLILHEFAHQLDFLDGLGDGTPPLPDRAAYQRWKSIMTESYEALVTRAEEKRLTLLDKYGATNPAEFFAVVTECFFEKPDPLRTRHPELYRAIADYYHQDSPGSTTES